MSAQLQLPPLPKREVKDFDYTFVKTKTGKTKKVLLSDDTPLSTIKALTFCYEKGLRITLDYGDRSKNKSWGEENDITGIVSLSNGETPCFILLPRSTSSGGGAILTGSILSIKYANVKQGGLIYDHKRDANRVKYG